ncbi:uncharacterized protein LOC141851270 isoform X2 [Brevipalpus obovatus]|uniref:uncharacterized protein LOC141851270 isoform X2 n=1 Tax=Brevipalpus obovatus TaxID=246614 RepID=UPI003D9FA0F9
MQGENQKDDLSEDEGEIVPPMVSLWTADHDEQQRRGLRQLLKDERERFEQLRGNFYLLKDQFIAVKNQRKKIEIEIVELRNQLRERDELLETMRKQMQNNSPDVLRHKIESEWKELIHRLERERERLSGELSVAKQRIQHLEKELVDSIERVRLESQLELNVVQKEKDNLKMRLIESSKTPEGQRMNALYEENQRLMAKLQEKRQAFEESILECEKIRNKLETSSQDYEKSIIHSDRQMAHLQSQLSKTTEENHRLERLVEELKQERENLLIEIKHMEKQHASHQEKMDQQRKMIENDKDMLKRQLIKEKNELEMDKIRQQDLMKLLRDDLKKRDETIRKLENSLEQRKEKYLMEIESIRNHELKNMEVKKLSLESQIDEISEDRARLKQELDKMRASLEQNIERSMSLEKDNVLLQAKVETLLSQQEEMTALRKERKSLLDDMSKLKENLAGVNVINKDLIVQRDRAQEDYSVLKSQLEAERKELQDFKVERDRDFLRLRKLIDDERDEVRQKFDHLQEDYRRKHQDREEMKIRCKQNVALVEKLQSKVKNLEDFQIHRPQCIKEPGAET